jgi:hypothetical protein
VVDASFSVYDNFSGFIYHKTRVSEYALNRTGIVILFGDTMNTKRKARIAMNAKVPDKNTKGSGKDLGKESGNGKSNRTRDSPSPAKESSRDRSRPEKRTRNNSQNRTRSVSAHGSIREKEDDSEEELTQAERDERDRLDKIKRELDEHERLLNKHQERYDCILKKYAIVSREAEKLPQMPGVSDKSLGDLKKEKRSHWRKEASGYARKINGGLKDNIIDEMKFVRDYYELLPKNTKPHMIKGWEIQAKKFEEEHKKFEGKIKRVGKILDDIPETDNEKREEVNLGLEKVDIESVCAECKALGYRRKINYVTGLSSTYEIPHHRYFSPEE